MFSFLLSADCHANVMDGAPAAILSHEIGVHCVLRKIMKYRIHKFPHIRNRHPSL